MMSDKIICSNCGSDQLTAMKKGFSGKKAVIGGLFTGGIGILAGTIGSGDIFIHCLNCGHKWDPKRDYEQKHQRENHVDNGQAYSLWKRRFIWAYKNYGKDEALKVLQENHSALQKYDNIETAYKALGNSGHSATIFFIVLAITAAILVLIFTR